MLQFTLVNAATAATFSQSASIALNDLQVFSIAVVVSGSNVAGTFTVLGSNDNVTFFPVSGSSQVITSSDDVFYDVTRSGYRFAALGFTYTSGTGTITATAVVKENIVKGA